MTKTRNILAIVAVTALLAALPTFSQEADAAISYVPHTTPEVAFEAEISFEYDIETGITYDYSTYDMACFDRADVTSTYNTSNNIQTIAWDFPDNINFLCGVSELAQYTDFDFTGVEWSIQSDGNSAYTGSSSSNDGADIESGYYSNSGTVYGTVTASYVWAN